MYYIIKYIMHAVSPYCLDTTLYYEAEECKASLKAPSTET